MKTIDLTREEIKNIIKMNSITNNSGLRCTYNENVLLKFDPLVLRDNSEVIEFNRNYISQIDVAKIDKLARLSNRIKLTTLPLGIAYCENVPVAIMVQYFKNHRNLLSLPCELKSNLFKVLSDINDIINELCQNYIYQLDIKENGFLYSKTNFKPEAIDLESLLLNVCSCKHIKQEELIYNKLIQMFISIIEEKMIVSGLSEDEINKRMEEVKSYYFGINNYYGVRALLRSVQKNNVLQKIK